MFGSAMASASRAPVRREKLSTSGVLEQDLLDVAQHPVGFGEAGARPREVVEHKRPFVHGRQEIGFQLP